MRPLSEGGDKQEPIDKYEREKIETTASDYTNAGERTDRYLAFADAVAAKGHHVKRDDLSTLRHEGAIGGPDNQAYQLGVLANNALASIDWQLRSQGISQKEMEALQAETEAKVFEGRLLKALGDSSDPHRQVKLAALLKLARELGGSASE